MKKTNSFLLSILSLVLVGFLMMACTEHQCYREHLKVFTEDYVAVCNDGYWEDFDAATYPYMGFEISAHERISEKCPVVQCIKKDCKCTDGYTREQIGAMQLADLLDEIFNPAP